MTGRGDEDRGSEALGPGWSERVSLLSRGRKRLSETNRGPFDVVVWRYPLMSGIGMPRPLDSRDGSHKRFMTFPW